MLGLAHALVRLRGDVTFPGDPGGEVRGGRVRPPCPVEDTYVTDDIWIPETARQGWMVITRDNRIRKHPAEIDAVRDSGARMVALAGRDALDTWHQLEVFMIQWRHIEALMSRSGPFIYSATRTSLRQIPLRPPPGGYPVRRP